MLIGTRTSSEENAYRELVKNTHAHAFLKARQVPEMQCCTRSGSQNNLERQIVCMANDSTYAVVEEVANQVGFHLTRVPSTAEAERALQISEDAQTPHRQRVRVLITALGQRQENSCFSLLAAPRKAPLFVCVYSHTAASTASIRLACFDAGANMVTADPKSLQQALSKVAREGTSTGVRSYTCPHPSCRLGGLSEDELWTHLPLYHSNLNFPRGMECPVCRKCCGRVAVHLHNQHGPPGRGEMASENDYPPSALHAFALVVCRRRSDGKYLLVQEFANSGFWLPGGRVDAGENLADAAVRETLEEAGVAIRLTGVLRFEYRPLGVSDTRMRVIFLAEPLDDTQPAKSIPDYESVGASWVSAEECLEIEARDRVRGPEPGQWVRYLSSGGVAAPMTILTAQEGSTPKCANEQ
ncbi:hypothetical protein CYMTET_51522 [Cymbomonas tetramitiformis]|uniref:Nudix hydrolase domain-containing protein n=1 Tax=Cymbomonas tetramitiformis TaxID=36881 RepID=A0AAE0BM18_9CHLO|nr:hypothetical protein CYMTET_51522 [Cymbomonas tetramitiformis]